MKKIHTFLAVITLVAFTANVCFASDVGVPAAIHSTIIKAAPVVSNIENTVLVFTPVKIERDLVLNVTIKKVNKRTIFQVPPLTTKHDSIKKTKSWC